MSLLSPFHFFVILAALTVSIAVKYVYRLFWHPLAYIPGPKIAACTSLYRAYYDIICDGAWSEHLHSLHDLYGNIVRVGPNELHFSNPEAYNDIYGSAQTFAKSKVYKSLGAPEACFSQIDVRAAQRRRLALGPLFSRRAILQLEPVIQEHVNNLISQLLTYQSLGAAADLQQAFRATAFDIITSYCFGSCFKAIEYPEFAHPIVMSMDPVLPQIWLFKNLPFLAPIMDALPQTIGCFLLPSIKPYYEQVNHLSSQIDSIMANPHILAGYEHNTMYHYLLENLTGKSSLLDRSSSVGEGMSRKEKATTRTWLLHEGLNFRFAGSDTSANACTIATFYLLRNTGARRALFEELVSAWPNPEVPLGYEELEKLSYLTAVIKEALRLSHGVVTPMPRIVGSRGGLVAGMAIPPGTTIAMGNTFMHCNPEIFPDPHQFNPERWLQTDSAMTLDRYLVAFSKGPRMCLGINLARCELYLILGNIFRKLDLQDDGSCLLKDLQFREYFLPLYRGHHLQAYVQKRT